MYLKTLGTIRTLDTLITPEAPAGESPGRKNYTGGAHESGKRLGEMAERSIADRMRDTIQSYPLATNGEPPDQADIDATVKQLMDRHIHRAKPTTDRRTIDARVRAQLIPERLLYGTGSRAPTADANAAATERASKFWNDRIGAT